MGRERVGEGYGQVRVIAGAREGLDGADVDGNDEVRVGVEAAARAEPRVEPRRCGGSQSRPCNRTDTRRGYVCAPSPPDICCAKLAAATERVARRIVEKRMLDELGRQ